MMMQKFFFRLIIVTALLGTWLGAGATIPAGYYNSIDGKSGQALKDAIHELATQHTVLNYYSLWNYFPMTDCRLDDKNKI